MVEEAKRKSEITAIFNKYKNIFDDLIDSSNTKSPDYPDFLNRPRLIDKGLHNALKSKNSSPTFLEEDCLDKNSLNMSLKLIPKI